MAEKDRSDNTTEKPGREPGIHADVTVEETPEQRAHREARRRVLLGGLASAPVILTLASRPAQATYGGGGYTTGGVCGYSGMLSGNLSQTETTTTYCKGKPPKYWKTREDDCNKHFNSGPCNPMYLDYTYKDYSVPRKRALEDYKKSLEKNSYSYYYNYYKIQACNQYIYWLSRYPGLDSPPFGNRFSEIFGSGIANDDKLTLMQALWLDGESPYQPSGSNGSSPLLAHCAAGFCNACAYGEDSYGVSPQGLVDMVQSEIRSDPYGLEEKLRMMNDQG